MKTRFLIAPLIILSACNQPTYQTSDPVYYAQRDTTICVDQTTGQRVPDVQCNPYSTYHHAHWYYLPSHGVIPYYGQSVGGGTYQRLPNRMYSTAPLRTARTLSITPVDHGVTKHVTVTKTVVTEKPKGFFSRFKPSARTTTTTTTRVSTMTFRSSSRRH